MSTGKTSIVLISNDPQKTSEISAMLAADPSLDFKECAATLSEMNGQASALAGSNDLVIFRTENVTENDIQALENLKLCSNGRAYILALSDGKTTLSDVQRLTRAGVNEVLSDDITTIELQSQIGRFSRALSATDAKQPGSGGNEGKVICIAQARGGVGATTLAVNLADQLLERTGVLKKTSQNKVALIDLDLQFGAISSFLDLEASDALYQLAVNGDAPDSTFLNQSMKHLNTGLSVLTAPARIAPLEALQKSQVAALLSILKSEFDYVVVDLPHALVEWVAPVLEASDRMLMVTDSSVPSIRQARRLIDFYTEDNLALQIEIVINHEAKPLVMGKHHSEASKVLERPFRHWVPYHPKAAREAVDRGEPLSKAAGGSSLSKGIKRIAKRMICDLSDARPQTKSTH